METILENIIEFAEKIWLRLDIFLDLESMRVLDFLRPLYFDILSDPFLAGLTIVVFTIILYGIYKIKKVHAEKESRLDALLQELDEDEDGAEADLYTPLFPNPTLETSDRGEANINTLSELEEKKSDDEIYGDEFESPAPEKTIGASEAMNQPSQEKIGDNLSWESGLEEWDELYDNVSEGLQETGTLSAAPNSENKTTLSEELDQTPHEVMDDDFNWDSTLEEWDELYDNVSEELQETGTLTQTAPNSENKTTLSEEMDQTPHEVMDDDFNWDSTLEEWDELYDNVSEGLQEADQSTGVSSEERAVSELGKESAEPVPEEEELEEVAEFLEAVSELGKESAEPVSEKEELEEVAEFLEAVSELGKESAKPVPEGEELDPKLAEADEAAPIQSGLEFIAPNKVPERIELSLEEIEVEPKLESDLATEVISPGPIQSEPAVIKPSASPLLKSMLNSSVSAKTDALVSRLKTFQAELETRFNSLEIEPEMITKALATESLRKKQSKYQPAKISYRSKQKSRSNKEYLSQLESFIFMAKQKNQKTDT